MPTSFRARLGARRVLGISAAPVDSADLFRALADHGIDGPKAPKGYAWSLYGAQLDAGCTLALATDADDLQARRDDYDETRAREIVNAQNGRPSLVAHWGPMP